MRLYYLFIIFPLVYTCLSVLNKGFYVPIVHRICNDIVLPIHKYIILNDLFDIWVLLPLQKVRIIEVKSGNNYERSSRTVCNQVPDDLDLLRF